jgi:hypothetical protein
MVHLFHIIIVGGLFLYVGISRGNTYAPVLNALFYLGIIIIFYHIYKVYGYAKQNKSYWVNLIHIFIVGPLLIVIGYNGVNTSRRYFELLLMLAFASIGYHSYYLF